MDIKNLNSSCTAEPPSSVIFLSLGDACKVVPGSPSTNCIWRWCRKGVLARSGDRIKLQHVRMGGKIFTTRTWLEQFGHQLAQADAAHFDRFDSSMNGSPTERSRREHIEQVDHELNEAGL